VAHQAEGPITVQPLRGRVDVDAAGESHPVEAGQVLALGPGVAHSVRSDDGAAFLLTVTHPSAA